jgi:hypothetical protein
MRSSASRSSVNAWIYGVRESSLVELYLPRVESELSHPNTNTQAFNELLVVHRVVLSINWTRRHFHWFNFRSLLKIGSQSASQSV